MRARLRIVVWGLAVLAGLSLAVPAAAQSLDSDSDPDALAFGAGWWDVVQNKDTAALLNLEYRSNKKLWWFKPQAGMFGTSKGGFYLYAGIRLDVYFGDRFVFTPSFSPGVYHEGNGRDLGFELEFRSSAEIAYRFDDYSRLSLGIAHLSNASLGDRNPGVETLTLTYSVPLSKLVGD
ncbi:MAG: acyloxyacyl hydrolase [Alphaproteobacteria bacterium]|nr:acyloxyacyl hydrolase [Alphaproteobacteria bacterium]